MNLSNENILHVKVNDVEFLKFKDLEKYGVVNAFSLKPLNFISRENISADYKKILDALNLEYKSLVKPKQMHTDNIIVLDEKQNNDDADIELDYLTSIDGIITNKSEIILATTAADCLDIVLFDTQKRVIANIHSGWRGTFQKIVQKALLKMRDVYGCNPSDLNAYFFPAIRKCHFEVDTDVMEECRNIFGYMKNINEIISVGRVVDGLQKYNIDNILINRSMLEELGIHSENIFDSGICSVCNSDIVHSRRADGVNFGLGTTVVMMKTSLRIGKE